jgi:hypothetical protein
MSQARPVETSKKRLTAINRHRRRVGQPDFQRVGPLPVIAIVLRNDRRISLNSERKVGMDHRLVGRRNMAEDVGSGIIHREVRVRGRDGDVARIAVLFGPEVAE